MVLDDLCFTTLIETFALQIFIEIVKLRCPPQTMASGQHDLPMLRSIGQFIYATAEPKLIPRPQGPRPADHPDA